MDESINLFNEVHDDLKFLAISNVRTKIMISLSFDSKNLKILRNETNMNSSTILHAMNQLEKKGWISHKGEFYSLSSTGKILALNLINIIQIFSSLEIHQKFWMGHDINRIPESSLSRIGMLKNSSIIESSNTNLTKPFNTYLKLLSTEKSIKSVSPILFSHHIEHVVNILKDDGTADIILTPEVFESLLENSNKKKVAYFLKSSRLNLWVTDEDLGVAFTATPSFFILSLFLENSIYDSSRILLSHDQEAISWGTELFEYYKKKSKKVDMKKLTLI